MSPFATFTYLITSGTPVSGPKPPRLLCRSFALKKSKSIWPVRAAPRMQGSTGGAGGEGTSASSEAIAATARSSMLLAEATRI